MKHAQQLPKGFKGNLITDSYAGYEKVENVIRCLCWSHVRRYFIESIPLNNGKEISGSKGAEGRDFWCWLEKLYPMNNKELSEAINYAKNQKVYLENFLLDGKIPISNNQAENVIRTFAVGRRGWLFADTPKGVKASVIAYSIVETVKANNLNVFQYLTYLFKNLLNINFKDQPELLVQYCILVI
jgi:hypothetical protein